MVPVAGGDPAAVRAEGHRVNVARVAAQHRQAGAQVHLPNPYRVVPRPAAVALLAHGSEAAAVRAEAEDPENLLVGDAGRRPPSRSRLVQDKLPRVSEHGKSRTVRTELRQAPLWHAQAQGPRLVPQAQGLVRSQFHEPKLPT